jgi:hypothetical protein
VGEVDEKVEKVELDELDELAVVTEVPAARGEVSS